MSGRPHRELGPRLAGALARAVLTLYPPGFRRVFGGDMVGAFIDRVEDAAHRGGAAMVWAIVRGVFDLTKAAALEWLHPTSSARGEARPHTSSAGDHGDVVDQVAQDVRFALRSLARRPSFAAVTILTLALGIGATTGVFSVIDGVLLEPLPYPDPSGLVVVWASDTDGAPTRGSMSQPDIESARGLRALAGLEGVASWGATLTGVQHPERVQGARVTGGLLSIFGQPPALGRDLREDENEPGASSVVVVSDAFWRRHLGGRRDVVGTTLELSEKTYEVVGVAPKGFDYPDGAQLWTPYRLDTEVCGRDCHIYRGAVGRLAPGVGLEQAQQSLTALAAALSSEFPDSNLSTTLRFERLIDYAVGDVRTGLWIVLGAVGLVLLIVCANVANLLLVRASTRRGEVAVRSALGASRRRLVAQMLTESVVLAGAGGGLGILAAFGVVDALKHVARDAIPRLDQVGVNATVLAFAAGLSLLVALVFGLSPAVRLARGSAASQIPAAGRSGDVRRRGGARSWLLASEVALSLALLVGAGLLMRSLGRLYGVDRGFDGRHVVRFTMSLPQSRYDSLPIITTFLSELEGRLEAIPGVEAVGTSFGAPLTRGSVTGGIAVEGRPDPQPGEETYASVRPVTPGYFDAMGLNLVGGRAPAATDRRDTGPIAVVNEALVRENFPNEDVIGKRLHVDVDFGFGSPTWTVVGVVHDVRRRLAETPAPAIYVPVAQFGPGFLTVHIKTRAGLESSVVTAARRDLAALDADVVPVDVQTMDEALRADAAPTRLYLMLVGLFAALAVVLAAIGLYGVVAYLVSQRTREIGVRIALGAKHAEITGLVFRQAAAPTTAGVLVGLGVALGGGRLMKSLLFEVDAADPMVFVGVTALVLGMCALAVFMPARRATRVDPVSALRSD